MKAQGWRQFVYVYPDIPPEKERNARAATGVPPDEFVWILIDYTVFGGAQDCLLAGRHGIFHRGGFWRSRVAITYEDLKDAAIIDTDGGVKIAEVDLHILRIAVKDSRDFLRNLQARLKRKETGR